MIKVVAKPRQAGKTHDAVEWVKQGREREQYPFWDRILVTHDLNSADRVRRDYHLDYRQVFALIELQEARMGFPPPAAVLDNVDLMLGNLLFGRARAEVITVHGEAL